MVQLSDIQSEHLRIYEAQRHSIEHLAANLRQEDIDEIEANSGKSPYEAISEGIKHSEHSWVIWSVEPLMTFGVMHDGRIWAVGSDLIKKHWRPFLRHSRTVIERLQSHYPILHNTVDARNKVHIRWLKWLDFKFIKLHPKAGVAEIPFWEFVRI